MSDMFDETNPDDWLDATGYTLLEWWAVYPDGESWNEAWERLIRGIKRDAWNEGRDAFEAAHRWDSHEPWHHLESNPYEREPEE